MNDLIKILRHNIKQNFSFSMAIIMSITFLVSLMSAIYLLFFRNRLMRYSGNNGDPNIYYRDLISSSYEVTTKISFLLIVICIGLFVMYISYHRLYDDFASTYVMNQLPVNKIVHRFSLYIESMLLIISIIFILNIFLYINVYLQEYICRKLMVINTNILTNFIPPNEIYKAFQNKVMLFSTRWDKFLFEILIIWPIFICLCTMQVIIYKIYKNKTLIFYGIILLLILVISNITGEFLLDTVFYYIFYNSMSFKMIFVGLICLIILFLYNSYLLNNKYEI